MLQGVALGFLAYTVFAFGDACIKALSGGPSVFEIGFFTTLFASVVMFFFGKPPDERWRDLFRMNHPRRVIARTVSGITSGVFAIIAFTHLPFAEAYALIFLGPVMLTVLSVVFLGEEVGWRRWLAVLIGFAGVLLVMRPGFRELLFGHVAALIVSLAGAITLLIMRSIGRSEKRTSLLGVVMLASLAFHGTMMIVTGFRWPTLHEFAFLISAGVVGGFGNLALLAATRRAPANRIAPTQYCQMVWAVVIGAVVYGEHPDGFVIAGVALIGFSGLFTFIREEKVSGWWRRIILIRNR